MSYMEISKNITKTVLMVVFSGRQQGIASMTIFEFKNFLEEHYPDYDKLFLKDEKVLWYTEGITAISNDIGETVEYLRRYIARYSKVVFIGASMGGFAALLYGSILNIDTIIAFRPQTFLSYVLPDFLGDSNSLYLGRSCNDVKLFINNKTKYYLYGDSAIKDPTDIHSINYCDNLELRSNIKIFRIDNFDIKDYKDKGELLKDFNLII